MLGERLKIRRKKMRTSLKLRGMFAALSIIGMFILAGCGQLQNSSQDGVNEKRARALEQNQERLEYRRNLRNW